MISHDLHAVAAQALEQLTAALDAAGGDGGSGGGGGGNGFDEAAVMYCESRRDILKRACAELASR